METNESSKVVFEGEGTYTPRQFSQEQAPKLVRLVMKYSGGLIKDEERANYVLIGIAAAAIIIALFLTFGEKNKREFSEFPAEMVDQRTLPQPR